MMTYDFTEKQKIILSFKIAQISDEAKERLLNDVVSLKDVNDAKITVEGSRD